MKEEPHCLISSLTITNTNYSVALNILRKRYKNKKVIVREHIHSIVSFNATKSENPTLLRKLIETTDKNVLCLQNFGVGAESWDHILFYLVTERLYAVTRKDWEQHASENSGTDLPSFSDLKTFVENRATALEAAYSKVQTPKTQKSLVAHVADHDKCPFCKDTHKIYACQKFIASPTAKRKEFVKTNNFCFNCPSHVHQSRNCTSASTCRHAKKRHHLLIHDESTAVISSADQTSQRFQLRYSNSQTILATALAPVLNGQNELVFCRALLDFGAESSFITEDCLQRLNLKSRKRNFTIQGVGGENLAQSNGSVDLTLGQDCDLKVKCAVF